MKIEVEHEYEHGLEKVYDTFREPAFYEEKFTALGDRNVEVLDSSDDEEGFWIEIEREVRLDVPGMLRSILGEWNALRQTEHWQEDDEGYSNELDVHSDLVPMKISGSMYLSGDDSACVNHVVMNVVSSVPLLGRQLEKFAAKNTADSLEREYDFIREYLARPRRKKKKR